MGSEEKNYERQNNVLTYFLIGLVLVQMLIVATQLIMIKSSGVRSAGGSSTSFPFWMFAVIPIFATRRTSQTERQKRNIMLLVVGLATLVLAGMVVFLYKAALS